MQRPWRKAGRHHVFVIAAAILVVARV